MLSGTLIQDAQNHGPPAASAATAPMPSTVVLRSLIIPPMGRPEGAATRPVHGDRSCRCARQRVHRLPSGEGRKRRRVHDRPAPASDVTTEPRNWSVNWRSKSSLRRPSAITASSGECGIKTLIIPAVAHFPRHRHLAGLKSGGHFPAGRRTPLFCRQHRCSVRQPTGGFRVGSPCT
jgi:hypothetical protein